MYTFLTEVILSIYKKNVVWMNIFKSRHCDISESFITKGRIYFNLLG